MKKTLAAFLLLAGAGAGACSSSSNDATATNDAGTANDAGTGDETGTTPGGGCTAARAALLGSVDSESKATLSVIDSSGSAKTFYLDASAGGPSGAAKQSNTFLKLGGPELASVTDVSSQTSTDWDLAVKRSVLYTNDGTGGPGTGGAVEISKDFDSVTMADATGATLGTEAFLDDDCNPALDPAGSPLTTFSTWYDYDQSTHVLTPHAGTWIVKGGTGTFYKLEILDWYAAPDGGTGAGEGGTFSIKVAAL